MNIDIKKNHRNENDYISVENLSSFKVNKLKGLENAGQTYIFNQDTNVLVRKSEEELVQFFSNTREQLKNILNEILVQNKDDFKNENEALLNEGITTELNNRLNLDENKYLISFAGIVDILPENPENGCLYGLNQNGKITYYLYLNNTFMILLDKEKYEEMFYKKNEVNSKFSELTSQINDIITKINLIKTILNI